MIMKMTTLSVRQIVCFDCVMLFTQYQPLNRYILLELACFLHENIFNNFFTYAEKCPSAKATPAQSTKYLYEFCYKNDDRHPTLSCLLFFRRCNPLYASLMAQSQMHGHRKIMSSSCDCRFFSDIARTHGDRSLRGHISRDAVRRP